MGHRFFVDEPITAGQAVLAGSEAHHLQHVMRATVGDEVVLLGRQGREEITAFELAAKLSTIPYEVLIALGTRSRRVYLNGA